MPTNSFASMVSRSRIGQNMQPVRVPPPAIGAATLSSAAPAVSDTTFYTSFGIPAHMPGEIASGYGNVSAWQGIKALGSGQYVIVGTSGPSPTTGYGVVYIGPASGMGGQSYSLNVMSPTEEGAAMPTSVYGVDYDVTTGLFTFVGCYTAAAGVYRGFAYRGPIESLPVTGSGLLLPMGGTYYFSSAADAQNVTFFHSTMNGYLVGASGTPGQPFASNTTEFAYLISLDDMNTLIPVVWPSALSNTAYGIWHNGGGQYTIVGGYVDEVRPNAAVMDFDATTGQFSNWSSIRLGDGVVTNYLSHFEGIYSAGDGVWMMPADAFEPLSSAAVHSYIVSIFRNPETGAYIYADSAQYVYPGASGSGLTSANSIAENVVVGLYNDPEESNSAVAYQCVFHAAEAGSALALASVRTDASMPIDTVIPSGANVPFGTALLESDRMTYSPASRSVQFHTTGKYLVALNVYVQETKLAAALLNVSFTVAGVPNQFTLAYKGLNETGHIGTVHGFQLSTTFVQQFAAGDTLAVTNVSSGALVLVNAYVPNAVGSMISVCAV